MSYMNHESMTANIFVMHSNQTEEQVAQAYYEIWTTEVGIGVKDNS